MILCEDLRHGIGDAPRSRIRAFCSEALPVYASQGYLGNPLPNMSLSKPMKPLHPNVTLSEARSTILHLLLARPSSVPFTLANISTFMSSASGLDKSLMIIQYPAKIAVALLVALAQKLVKENAGKGVSGGGPLGKEVLRSRAALYAVRLKALSSSIGDARTMMRLLGKSGHSPT